MIKLVQNLIFYFLKGISWIINMLMIAFTPSIKELKILHISYPIHTARDFRNLLRDQSIFCDYLAIGQNPHFNDHDYHYIRSNHWYLNPLKECLFFWKIFPHYSHFHYHFTYTLGYDAWELKVLKKMNRKIIFHFRGCEIRDPNLNQKLHPTINICQNCDLKRKKCQDEPTQLRKNKALKYSDLQLVTTPDMKDFLPDALHFPFFSPKISSPHKPSDPIKIVHATNHPSIEGTDKIKRIIENLKKDGYKLEFKILTNLPHQAILKELETAHLSIGKMKMGYYANFQIESLAHLTPAICWVRDDLITEDIKNSGLIITRLNHLESTLKDLLNHPEKIKDYRNRCHTTLNRLHNNTQTIKSIIDMYQNL